MPTSIKRRIGPLRVRKWVGVILTLLPAVLMGRAWAGTVVTDGSVGPRQTLGGPAFTIGPNLGMQRGGNLFHSFTNFDLDAGDTATFTGPSSVQYVFARVTGGQPSAIDGTIACTIPGASFYLINPSGVAFGPDARLDVHGSFVVSSAANLQLGAQGRFDATHPAQSVLSSAPPAAFGFLGAPAAVSVHGGPSAAAQLAVPTGQSITVAAGGIQISHGQLLAPSGGINLLSVSGTGDVAVVRESGASAAPAAPGAITTGPISVTGRSAIATDGSSGGPIVVAGGALLLNHSAFSSNSLGGRGGRGIVLDLTGDFSDLGGTVESDNSGRGAGGDIAVTAANITLDGRNDGGLVANSLASGAGGDITVQTGFLRIIFASLIDVRPYGTGPAGSVDVTASRIVMNSFGTASDSSDTGIDAYSLGTAASGNVQVNAGSLALFDGAAIATLSTNAGGVAGNIRVTATHLLADGSNTASLTGISADGDSDGTGGDISIHAGIISLIGGATFTSSIFGAGNAGSISITAKRLNMDGTGATGGNVTQITVETNPGSTGNAGPLAVNVGELSVVDGGQIIGDTYGSGIAGSVRIEAGSISLIGSDTAQFATALSALGPGGSLEVYGGRIRVLSGAEVDASSGGTVGVTADALLVDGSGSGFFTGITAQTVDVRGRGNAGNLSVAADSLILRRGGRISDDTFGRGDGGDLSVAANNLIIDGDRRGYVTGIDASSRASATGAGGDVLVNAGDLTIENGGTISAATLGVGRGGSVNVHASSITIDGGAQTRTFTGIDAQSEPGATGKAGDVTVSSDSSIDLQNGGISALSAQSGGNVSVSAPLLITLADGSTIVARGQGNGGNIAIDPLELTLATGSTVNANGGDLGGNISIAADALPGARLNPREGHLNITATGSAGVSGSINTGPANSDIARSVAALPASLNSGELTLQPQCGQMLDLSTFLIQGRGGVAVDPGFWQTNFELSPLPGTGE